MGVWEGNGRGRKGRGWVPSRGDQKVAKDRDELLDYEGRGGGGGERGWYWQGSSGGDRDEGAPLCAGRGLRVIRNLNSYYPRFVDFMTHQSIWTEPLKPGGPPWSPSPPSPATL